MDELAFKASDVAGAPIGIGMALVPCEAVLRPMPPGLVVMARDPKSPRPIINCWLRQSNGFVFWTLILELTSLDLCFPNILFQTEWRQTPPMLPQV